MRALMTALVLGTAAAAVLPAHDARAWWDGYGRWHPNVYAPRPYYAPPGYYGPPAFYAPPAAYYARPYGRWLPPHYDRFGRFIPGHWG